MPEITFTLNGEPTTVPYEEGMHFLELLREECGVTSAKDGCAPQGTCGCCKIMVDGRPTLSCLRRPEQMEGREVVTLEGVPEAKLAVLAEAFVQDGGVQCGFCTPGIVMRAASLMEGEPDREKIAKATAASSTRCSRRPRPGRRGRPSPTRRGARPSSARSTASPVPRGRTATPTASAARARATAATSTRWGTSPTSPT